MDTIKTMLAAHRSWKGSKQVATVAVYEDSSTDARVAEFCRCLSRHLGEQCEVLKQMWLLNELRLPRLRTIAAGDAAGADLVIVSVHHAQKLPEEVTLWINLWLARKSRRSSVLLALFDPVHAGDSGSMQTYLAQAARKGSLEFMVHTEEMFDER